MADSDPVDPKKARVILDLVRLANEHGVPVRVFADPEHQLECLELEMFGRRMKEGLLNAHVLEQTRVI